MLVPEYGGTKLTFDDNVSIQIEHDDIVSYYRSITCFVMVIYWECLKINNNQIINQWNY